MDKYNCKYCNKKELIFMGDTPIEETDKILTMELQYKCQNCDKDEKVNTYVSKYINNRDAK